MNIVHVTHDQLTVFENHIKKLHFVLVKLELDKGDLKGMQNTFKTANNSTYC